MRCQVYSGVVVAVAILNVALCSSIPFVLNCVDGPYAGLMFTQHGHTVNLGTWGENGKKMLEYQKMPSRVAGVPSFNSSMVLAAIPGNPESSTFDIMACRLYTPQDKVLCVRPSECVSAETKFKTNFVCELPKVCVDPPKPCVCPNPVECPKSICEDAPPPLPCPTPAPGDSELKIEPEVRLEKPVALRETTGEGSSQTTLVALLAVTVVLLMLAVTLMAVLLATLHQDRPFDWLLRLRSLFARLRP